MISYTEKGAGLHAAISAAGHSLSQLDGKWVASNEAAVQAIIDGYDPAIDLRKTLNVPKKAFFTALTLFPSPIPGHLHLLDTLAKMMGGLRGVNEYDLRVVWFDTVTVIMRAHPDMAEFAALFGISPAQLDAICQVGLMIDAGASQAEIMAVLQ